VLARLDRDKDGRWIADHRVRRFIRPVLMRDPQVEIERQDREKRKKAGGAAATGAGTSTRSSKSKEPATPAR
jgi:hypothetical protein